MERLGRAAAVGVGVAAGLAALAALAGVGGRGLGRVEAMNRAELSTAQANSSATPTLKVYSRETVVDVTVTDAKGHPVHDLKQSDFTVTEDGAPQPIRSFQEFGSVAPVAATQALPTLPPNVYTNLQTGNGPLYVLLFDDINGGDIAQARWDAAKFIKKMSPGTRVALLALGDRLTVLQGPTSDPALLLQMVNAYVKPLEVEAMHCTRQIAIDRATLDQLNQVATYLSGVKGRKNLIWIGNGISDIVWNRCQVWNRPLQKTYDLLEDAQVTIYPLDPNGVRPLGGSQLTMEAVAEATGGVAYYERNDLDTLMAEAVNDGSSYYTLSYVPPSVEYDGRYHAISIKVDRPGVHLLYRKGYSAEDPTLIEHPPEKLFGIVTRDTRPTGPATDPFVAAMSPIAPPATQLLFAVRAEPSNVAAKTGDPAVMGTLDTKLKGKPLTRYGFSYSIPAQQIAFADGPNATRNGSLELEIAVYDADSKLVTGLSQTVKMPLSEDRYKQFIQGSFRFSQQIDLPPGQMFVRVGVLDKASNKVGTLEIPLTVAKRPVGTKAGR